MMNRQNNVPFNALPIPKGAAPVYKQQQQQPPPGRIAQDFRDAMIHIPVKLADKSNIRTSGMAANTQEANRPGVKSSTCKWKSSFKPLGEKDDSPDTSPGSSERAEIYNPYDPVSSDSEQEMLQAQDHSQSQLDQDNNLGRQRLSLSRGCHKKRRWGSSYSESVSQPDDGHDFSPENRPIKSPGHRLPERQAYSPNTESLDRLGLVCSPDRHIHSSHTQCFPESYGGQRTNGDERIIPDFWKEMPTTVRLSPSRLQRDYQQLEYMEKGLDQITPSTEVPRNSSMNIMMNKSPITCDLCDVELASGLELENHLESKSHWDTLEHIQQHNEYNDLTIAFLQEVMLYKSHQCSRAIEDSALQALQENDHMTKIEMFHCAACRVFVYTSAASVQAHITSQEHISNTKEFQVQQKHACLDKAETIMKTLKPQFEHFLKGGSPFE